MELVRLNAYNQEEKLIEGYDSLIWAERFGTCGDFRLTTGNVQKYMQLLPEQSVVVLRDSGVPMIVETHDIKTPKNGPESLEIIGRSFESVLDRRAWVGSNASGGFNGYSPAGLAQGLMEVVCNIGFYSAKDMFPPDTVQFSTTHNDLPLGPLKSFDIPSGNFLAVLEQLLSTHYPADYTTTPYTPAVVPHRLRASRKGWPGWETWSGATYFNYVMVNVYHGLDRRHSVTFAADANHLNDGRYLFSKVGSANVAYGVPPGKLPGFKIDMFEGAVEPSGMERRVILVDASDSNVSQTDALRLHMSTTLSEAKETAIFDGTVNPDISEYQYGVDYNLGDIVTIKGRFGLEEIARVTEYIRIKDRTGIKSYPTLTTLETT